MLGALSRDEQMEEYKLLFQVIPYPILIYEKQNQKILAINKEAKKLYGYSVDEFLELSLEDISSCKLENKIPQLEKILKLRKDEKEIAVRVKDQPIIFQSKNAIMLTISDLGDCVVKVDYKNEKENCTSNCSLNGENEKITEKKVRSKIFDADISGLIAVIDKKGFYKYVSGNAEEVLGIEVNEFIGNNALNFIHLEDLPKVKESLNLINNTKHVFIPPYRFRDVNKKWRWLETQLVNDLSDPTIQGIIAISNDITHKVEERLNKEIIKSLVNSASQTGTLLESLNEVLRRVLRFSTINIAEIWLVSEDKSDMDLFCSLSNEVKLKGDFYMTKAVNRFKPGVGLPGNIWMEQSPIIWDDLQQNQKFIRRSNALKANIKTGIGIPIFYNEEVLGCLLCLSKYRKEELKGQTEFLVDIGKHIGPVIKQKVVEENYNNFFNLSPYPHCIVDYKGVIKKCNQSFTELLQYPILEILGSNIFNFLHPDEDKNIITRIKFALKNKVFQSLRTRFISKSKEIKWLEWNGKVIPETKNIILVAKDITIQIKSEEKLNLAYTKLKAAQKIAKIGYWSRDLDSDLSVWSEETYKIYGKEKNNFIPTKENIIKAFHPDDRHYLENPYDKYVIPGQNPEFEHRIITDSKQMRWVKQKIKVIADEDNTPNRIEGIIQDITEKKNQELKLKLSNERFVLAQKASNELIWEMDFRNKTISRGEGYLNYIDYNTKEKLSINNSWTNKIYSEDFERVCTSFEEILKCEERNFWNGEYRILNRDNSIVYLVDRCYILRDKDRNPIKVVGSVLDISNSKRQTQSIRKQNEQLQEIAWLQSHTIRSPLSRILGLVYLYKDANGGEKTLEEILDYIGESAEELDTVVKKIVEMTNKFKHEADLIDR